MHFIIVFIKKRLQSTHKNHHTRSSPNQCAGGLVRGAGFRGRTRWAGQVACLCDGSFLQQNVFGDLEPQPGHAELDSLPQRGFHSTGLDYDECSPGQPQDWRSQGSQSLGRDRGYSQHCIPGESGSRRLVFPVLFPVFGVS